MNDSSLLRVERHMKIYLSSIFLFGVLLIFFAGLVIIFNLNPLLIETTFTFSILLVSLMFMREYKKWDKNSSSEQKEQFMTFIKKFAYVATPTYMIMVIFLVIIIL